MQPVIRTDMAHDVTYADLRFVEVLQKEKEHSETPHERDSHSLDDTYENVDKPPREKKVPEVSPSGRWHPLLTGFRRWSPHLALLFLMLSLILSTITIERTIKYLHVSSELQALSTSHQAINRSLIQNVQSREHVLTTLQRDLQTTEQTVKQLTEETERLASSLQRTEDELQAQRTITNRTQMELERAEKKMSEEQAKFADICPEGWILVGSKCVLLTDVKGKWMDCVEFCKNRGANLIVILWNDLTLQEFLSNKTDDFWVGKEYRWSENFWSWEWPEQYWIQNGNCWKISKRGLMYEKCSEERRCVCEKNLVLTTIRTYASGYDLPYLILSGTEYYCLRTQSGTKASSK
ncbi:C-type lectin domain family 7 member A-like isoform X2 [Ranitomeya imitator]|uniref:C-type lectin domain family 7 member A-like isoform X2 n=1 Tax=Ranitomeya imitator TaxID=111125 RepID=UPI0037E81C0F